MKPLAIHNRLEGYNKRWLEYCQEKSIPYQLVNCYESDIIETLKGCSALLWHWDYDNYKDRILANKLITSLKYINYIIFPDFHTSWYFDDKIAQKYLLESIGAPMPKTDVFYSKLEAINWVKTQKFPIIFKLKGGAGSQNVFLIKNFNQAKRKIKKAFNRGYKHINQYNNFIDKINYLLRDFSVRNIYKVIKAFFSLFYTDSNNKLIPREKGYALFQEYLPNNKFDTRLVVIGNRCLGLRRYNRKNDFRASGSGFIEYNKEHFTSEQIKIAFNVAKQLKSQTIAFDFINDKEGKPTILEISYGISIKSYDECVGFWDSNLNFFPGKRSLSDYMIEDLIASLKNT